MKQVSLLARFLIILFWLILFVSLLYIPHISKLFAGPRSITLLTWAEMIDPQIVATFERQTGITVNLRYFENNEELFAKLLVNKGQGFDAIIPSDYIVEKLIQNKLVMKIDKNKLFFWPQLDQQFLHHYYDPENDYSIPYNWSVYGLGINKNYFAYDPPADWKLLFENKPGIKVQMPGTARESFSIGAMYLFKSIDRLSDDKIDQIERLLIHQKKWVEAYTDTDVRAEYLLVSNTCPLVVVASSFMPQILNSHEHFDYLLPDPKTFMIIDNIMILSGSRKAELVYSFINFLYKQEVLKYHMDKYPFTPTIRSMWSWLQELSPRLFERIVTKKNNFEFFKTPIQHTQLHDLWIRVKVS